MYTWHVFVSFLGDGFNSVLLHTVCTHEALHVHTHTRGVTCVLLLGMHRKNSVVQIVDSTRAWMFSSVLLHHESPWIPYSRFSWNHGWTFKAHFPKTVSGNVLPKGLWKWGKKYDWHFYSYYLRIFVVVTRMYFSSIFSHQPFRLSWYGSALLLFTASLTLYSFFHHISPQ